METIIKSRTIKFDNITLNWISTFLVELHLEDVLDVLLLNTKGRFTEKIRMIDD